MTNCITDLRARENHPGQHAATVHKVEVNRVPSSLDDRVIIGYRKTQKKFAPQLYDQLQHAVKDRKNVREIRVLQKNNCGFFYKHKTAIAIGMIATAIVALLFLETARRSQERMNRLMMHCSWRHSCNPKLQGEYCSSYCPPEAINQRIKYPDPKDLYVHFNQMKEGNKVCQTLDFNSILSKTEREYTQHFCNDIAQELQTREDKKNLYQKLLEMLGIIQD